MATSRVEARHEDFFCHLTTSGAKLLLLDYDGTIAPFTRHRERAFPYPAVRQILNEIMSTGTTRLVIVSGRPADELSALLRLDGAPEIWGSHGLEQIRIDGSRSEFPIDQHDRETLSDVRAQLHRGGLENHLEDKPGGIAVHWRGVDKVEADFIRVAASRIMEAHANHDRMRILPFDGGIELRVASPNKGTVVRMLREEVGSSAAIAYLGDDRTDEDAFYALGEAGLSALVRQEYRATAAQLWLKPPEELIGFLSMWLNACGGYQ